MAYLLRPYAAPRKTELTPREIQHLERHFAADSIEINIDGEPIDYGHIDEVEVAQAARVSALSGWLVKNLFYGGERYHVGVYFGRGELVLPNLTLNAAKYVVQIIAYYSHKPIRYTGPDGLSPLSED
ncbi:MAG: hypothetical protein GYB67_12830 [Chloroflexi bacterium]|nr:hypothetical protein [Chloroflexota bacterium]